VLVGRVADIRFDNKRYQATVVLALDKRYAFPKDTSAAIQTSGLLGENYVGLDAGGDDKNLGPGDRIMITQSAVVLEKLIGQFLFSKAQEEPAAPSGKPEPGKAEASPAPAPAAVK